MFAFNRNKVNLFTVREPSATAPPIIINKMAHVKTDTGAEFFLAQTVGSREFGQMHKLFINLSTHIMKCNKSSVMIKS